MNPWAFLVVVIAVALVVIGVKGSQDNFLSAVLGRPYGQTTLASTKVGHPQPIVSPTLGQPTTITSVPGQ